MLNFEDEVSISSQGASQRTSSEKLLDVITTPGESPEIGTKESTAVLRARLLLIMVLLLSALALAIGTFTHTSNKEEEAFQNAFEFQSNRLFSVIGDEFTHMFGTIDDFSTTVLSIVKATGNQEWPFVIIPNFAVHAAKAISLSHAVLILTIHPVVSTSQFDNWTAFSSRNNVWIDEVIELQKEDTNFHGKIDTEWLPSDAIHTLEGPLSPTAKFAAPAWQTYPFDPTWSLYNWDLNSYAPNEVQELLETKRVVLGLSGNLVVNNSEIAAWTEGIVGANFPVTEPHGIIYYPLMVGSNDRTRFNATLSEPIVGLTTGIFYWRDILEGHLPSDATGLVVVVENECGQSFTYQLDGSSARYLGTGDIHDQGFSRMSKTLNLANPEVLSGPSSAYSGAPMSEAFCPYHLSFYASAAMRDSFLTNQPIFFTLAVIIIFVERRQYKVLMSAKQSSAIVSSLFPSNVRDRLYAEQQPKEVAFLEKKQKLRHYLAGMNVEMNETVEESTRYVLIHVCNNHTYEPWRQTREPSQVFQLLESIFKEFDQIAKRRRIFKVETVGDCYVAVVGLPDPRKDHGIAMARFAMDCMNKFHLILPKLEIVLGPDTAELSMRMGVHSGSVTAGVLRGERSRFQLFGDTMNTASRMETTSLASRIQVSEETANLLIEAGKGDWIIPREGTISVKGKGEMKTYWLQNRGYARSNTGESASCDDTRTVDEFFAIDLPNLQKTDRLIKWNVEIMLRLLKKINSRCYSVRSSTMKVIDESRHGQNYPVVSQAVEVIRLPKFNKRSVQQQEKPLGPEVERELTLFVGKIASMYRIDCPFHGFEHASHVVMSVTKLLSRIVAPTDLEMKDGHAVDSVLHDHTYGITSDPLTQFSVVFSALIHDAGHVGVPNTQLVKESPQLVETYGNKSVAEQNSINLAWNLLMESRFSNLRAAIYHSNEEKTRFKQLVVNSVLATDIVDKELKALRNSRWQKAFSSQQEFDADNVHRKATIVIEHLIQASDVAHTMQHWIVFRKVCCINIKIARELILCKWNERLFMEMYKAFLEGRAEKDPTEFWYEGEIGFFDFYIIPLAKKLKECGVFGVSSDEYLQYASRNREEWEHKGREVVASMKVRARNTTWGGDSDNNSKSESEGVDDGIEATFLEL